MVTTDKYTLFYNGAFSNFFPCEFEIDGIKFCTSEQYFMYKKALTFNDHVIANLILNEPDPLNQKQLGRGVADYNDDVWSKVRYQHMYDGCFAKFTQNAYLKSQLLYTVGTNLVEASPYDTIWGIGLSEIDPLAWDESNWKGLNLLGKVLDEVRETILTNSKKEKE